MSRHTFVNPQPDGADATVVRPSDWNDYHALNNIAWWIPRGAGTTLDSVGANGPTGTGTVTGRNPTNTNYATGIKRIGYVSAAGAASVAGARNTAAQYWRGNSSLAGGFHVVFRWMISDASIITTGRMFIGLQASTAAPTDVDPSTFANIIGVGCDANDTVLQLYAAGVAAQARTSLGANFPANTTNADAYELELDCAPNATTLTYKLTRLTTGVISTAIISDTAKLPVNTTFLTQQMWRTNGVTAAAVGLDVIVMYAETDL
jgi:hypothetical protein